MTDDARVSLVDAVNDTARRHIVSISGGKDSSALAIYLRKNYPDTKFEFAFADTGAELPEIYDYLDKLEAFLDIKINRLRSAKAKEGESAFDAMLAHYKGFLPAPHARWCTRELKIVPLDAFCGDDLAYQYIGIRGDEGDRGRKKNARYSLKENILCVYPFRDIGYGLADVMRTLNESGLGMPEFYKWRSRTGCYFCFYQRNSEWQGLLKNHPDLFAKAEAYEQANDGIHRWRYAGTLDQIRDMDVQEKLPGFDEAVGCHICHL